MNAKWRLHLVTFSFIVCGFLLLARLFYWQVLASDQLINLAQSQQQTTLEVPAQRGQILFSDNTVLVANQPAYQAYLIKDRQPAEITGLPEKLVPIIFSSLTQPASPSAILSAQVDLSQRLSNPDLSWLLLARKLTQEQKWALESLGLTNLNFQADQSRLYPEASMAAHLVGFVGQNDQAKDIGLYGLEGFYQTELTGRPGIIRQEQDAFSQPILFGQFLQQGSKDGRQLKLHLNKSLQFLVEKKLTAALDRYGAKAGSVTVMDPFTGAILAMASLPAYEPKEYMSYDPKLFLNPVIADAFEPGSIFKIFVMAAAIDSKVVKPDTICDTCDGPIKIDKYTINTWDNKYRPNETVTDIIVHSDNVGMVFVGQKLGLDKFLDYFKKFGLTQKTNIDLQDELVPETRPDDKWTYVDLATASFGQGFVVTGIQLLQAAAAIANGGNPVQPRLVNQVISDRQTITIPVRLKNRVISQDTAQKVTDMMVAAAKEGEAKWTNVKGYKIAGKTGTAQVVVGGKYASELTNASFIGFAPADKPKFVMLVTLKEPSSSPWASETAAPLWFSIAQDLLNHFNVVPGE